MSTIDVRKMDEKLQTYYENNQKESVLNADNFVENNKQAIS